MTSKGQVLILKGIRKKLGLNSGQSFIEKEVNGKVVLEPVPRLANLGGVLKNIARKKKIVALIRETKEGWG